MKVVLTEIFRSITISLGIITLTVGILPFVVPAWQILQSFVTTAWQILRYLP